MKRLNNQKGLTLLELLAVIVVLGIIAAIAIPAIQGTIEKQRINADEKSEEIIEAAALRYFYDYYPEGPEGGVVTGSIDVINNGSTDSLHSLGYLAEDFSPKLQSADNEYFAVVTAQYSASNGWHTIVVSTETSDPRTTTP